MDLIRWSMTRPVSVAVGVILIVVFGLIGLGAIPIQLTPTVDRPVVTVTTSWPGRSPEEIVDTITKEQEKRLKNVGNLKSMRSTSSEGQASVTLEFYLGANINRALQEVSDALRQVPAYPDEVDEPVIKAAEGSAQNAIAWKAVADDVVERCADCVAVAAIENARWQRAVVEHVLAREIIQSTGGDAFARFRNQHVEAASSDPAGLGHASKRLCAVVEFDLADIALGRFDGLDVVHAGS